nr:MAG TPA: 4Fe-4S single cluster domain protein [Caudoviricetes sp.]
MISSLVTSLRSGCRIRCFYCFLSWLLFLTFVVLLKA